MTTTITNEIPLDDWKKYTHSEIHKFKLELNKEYNNAFEYRRVLKLDHGYCAIENFAIKLTALTRLIFPKVDIEFHASEHPNQDPTEMYFDFSHNGSCLATNIPYAKINTLSNLRSLVRTYFKTEVTYKLKDQ